MYLQITIPAIGIPSLDEFIIIFVVMLLLFGDKFPDVARTVGRWVGDIQKMFFHFRDDIINPMQTNPPAHPAPNVNARNQPLPGSSETPESPVQSCPSGGTPPQPAPTISRERSIPDPDDGSDLPKP
jgi:Sec-independent protein translocase protein TatA